MGWVHLWVGLGWVGLGHFFVFSELGCAGLGGDEVHNICWDKRRSDSAIRFGRISAIRSNSDFISYAGSNIFNFLCTSIIVLVK